MEKPRRSARARVRPGVERLNERCLLSGYTVAQVRHAYGLDAISFATPDGGTVAGDGTGQTIAIVEAFHDATLASDLHVFDQASGLPDPSLTVVNLAGGQSDPIWTTEEAMDVEWAHAIAPGASILVVEAASDGETDLMHAVDIARATPGVVAVSMSFGFGESGSETRTDAHFQTPAGHPGVTFLAASGDSGPSAGSQYPASSPRVVSVGGTSLAIDPAGNYLGETSWSGSGGGYSPYEPEPGYQRTTQATRHRGTPDVAFLGDPETGVAVFETPPRSHYGFWITVGGTSLGTPAWAGIIAIVDQGRALQGKASLDGATQTLPALYALPASDFHAVPGPTAPAPSGGGFKLFGLTLHARAALQHARRKAGVAPRTNTATGLGSPVGPALIDGLVASDLTLPLGASLGRRARAHAHASARPMRHLARPHAPVLKLDDRGRSGPPA